MPLRNMSTPDNVEGENLSIEKTPEEIAAEEGENKQKKEEAKAKAALPQNAVASYLRTIPMEIQSSKKMAEEAAAETANAAQQKAKYIALFSGQCGKLKGFRSDLDEIQAKQTWNASTGLLKDAQL